MVRSDLSRFSSWTMFLMFHHVLLVESLWDVDSCRLLSVGSDSVCSLLGLEDSVWASCANRVTVIQESSLQTQVDHRLRCLKSSLPLIMDSKSLIRICGRFWRMGFDLFHHITYLPTFLLVALATEQNKSCRVFVLQTA